SPLPPPPSSPTRRSSDLPQAGILPEPSRNALFLILRVRDPASTGTAVARVAAETPALVHKVGAIDPRARLVCTVSFGSEFWDARSEEHTSELQSRSDLVC